MIRPKRSTLFNEPPQNLPDESAFPSFHLVPVRSVSTTANVSTAERVTFLLASQATRTKSVAVPATNLLGSPSTGIATPTGPFPRNN